MASKITKHEVETLLSLPEHEALEKILMDSRRGTWVSKLAYLTDFINDLIGRKRDGANDKPI